MLVEERASPWASPRHETTRPRLPSSHARGRVERARREVS